MNEKNNTKFNSSFKTNSNSNPFPKLVPRGSININQKPKKEENEEISRVATYNSNLHNKGNSFLSKLKMFDPNITKDTEIIIERRNTEKKRQEEEKKRKKEENEKKKKEEAEKKEKEEKERIKKINEENKKKEEEEKRKKDEERRRKKKRLQKRKKKI